LTSNTLSSPLNTFPQTTNFIDSDQPSGLQSIAYKFLWVYTFLLISRASEFVDSGDNIHLAFITAALAGAGALITGGFFRAFNNRIGIALGIFTAWLIVEAPFSTWRGGTFHQLTEGWLKSYSTFLIVVALMFTMKQVKGMFLAVSLATIVVVCVSMAQGVENVQDSRLATTEGTLANSNDLAAALLLGLPFLLQCAADAKRHKIFRILAGVSVPPLLLVILRTGSRGALVAIAILIAIYLIRTTLLKRLVILLVIAAVGFSTPFFISRDVFDRYKTLFLKTTGVHKLNEVEASAIESQATREKLIEQAGELTMKHPFFGVGLGQFAPQAADLSLSHGEAPVWRTAHSFLVLVVTETGIPGLIFYCSALVFTWLALMRISRQARKQHNDEILAMSRTLFYSFLCFVICATFSTNAFTFHVPFLAAMVVGFSRLAKQQLDRPPQVVLTPQTESEILFPAQTPQAGSRWAIPAASSLSAE